MIGGKSDMLQFHNCSLPSGGNLTALSQYILLINSISFSNYFGKLIINCGVKGGGKKCPLKCLLLLGEGGSVRVDKVLCVNLRVSAIPTNQSRLTVKSTRFFCLRWENGKPMLSFSLSSTC